MDFHSPGLLYSLFTVFSHPFSHRSLPRIPCSAFLFCTLVFNHPRSTGSSLVTRVNPGELQYDRTHLIVRRDVVFPTGNNRKTNDRTILDAL